MYRQQYPDDPGMHNDGYNTRVTYRRNPTFCERISGSLVAFFIGLLLLLVASGLTFWNEGRAVQTARSLDEGLNVVIPLETVDVAFDNHNGKLVHLSGPLHTKGPLTDPIYQATVHAVKLRRTVEMYQWVEHESKTEVNEGDRTREETTYSYNQEWRSDIINSDSFYRSLGHENPKSMPVSSTTLVAPNPKIGSFSLSESLVEKVNNYQQVSPHDIPPQDPHLKLHHGLIFQSKDPTNPQIGDLRIKLEFAGQSGEHAPDVVSVVARQLGEQLLPYQTEAGDVLELLYFGFVSPKDMFTKEHAQNTMLTWALRFGGWFLMFIGFGCLTSIITTLVDWLPIVRELVGLGVCMMNVSLSLSLSLTVIALGWIWYRPLLGAAILVMACVPLILGRLRGVGRERPGTGYRQSYPD